MDLGPEGNRAANARAESNARARGIEPVYQNAPNGSVNNPAQRQYQIPNPPPGGGYQQLPKSQGNAPQQYTKLDLGPEGNRAANARAESNARARGIEPVYQNAPNGSVNNPAQRQYQIPNPPPGGGYQQLPKSQAPQYQAIDLTDRPRNQAPQYQAIDLTDRPRNQTQQYERLDLGNRQPEVNARTESNARARGIEPVYQNTPNGNRGNQAQRQYQIPDPASSDRYQQLEKRPNGQYSAPPVGGNAPVNGQYSAPPVGGNPPVNGQYAAPPVGGNAPVNGQYSAPPVSGNAPVNGQYAAPPVRGNAPVNGQYAAPPVGGNAPVNGQYQQLKVNPPEKPSRANKPNLNNPPEKPSRANKPNLNNPPEKPSRASKPNLNNPPKKPSRANKPNLNNPPEKPSRANKPKLNSSSVKPARTNIRPASSGKSGGSTRPKTRSPR